MIVSVSLTSLPSDLRRLAQALEKRAIHMLGDYREQPMPSLPTVTLPGPARIPILAARAERGEALWHPHDVQAELYDGLGRRIRVLANGRVELLDLELIGSSEGIGGVAVDEGVSYAE